MRAFVFTDRSLARHAGRFVWLEIDTEKRKNAALKQRLGIPALPTFFILDSRDEHVALRWTGGATVSQLEKILDDGSAAVAAASKPPDENSPSADADRALLAADRLYGEGKYAEAAAGYQEALAAAPGEWPRYGRVVESLLFALGESDQHAASVQLAREAWPRLAKTPSAASVASYGLDAAVQLPDSARERPAWIAELEQHAREILADGSLPLAADDRSGLYISLLDARKAAKDEAGARKVAEAWSAFLDGEAAKARTPSERTVFDPHRVAAYIEIGSPERAIPMLEQSERDFPDDYNPPARLAIAYRAMKRWKEGLAASDRALARAYGPRELGMLQVRADLYAGLADTAQARKTLEDAIAMADSLPPGQRSESTIASLKKKLEAMR